MEAKLAKALVKFRGIVKTIGFDSSNPHFKSKFASMAAIHKAINPWLTECGLTVLQQPINPPEGHGVGVRTIILHESGESIESDFFLPTMKNDPQSAGSSVSYARRYAISGVLGLVTDEDEDGEAAMGRRDAVMAPAKPKGAREKSRKQPAMSAENRDKLKEAADARILKVGTPDTPQIEPLRFAAKALGKSSPIELVDSEFDQALKFVGTWVPDEATAEGGE